MAQEAPMGQQSARDYVISGDRRIFDLLSKAAQAEANEDFDTAAKLHQELDAEQGYEAQRRAERLLTGLGFSADQTEQRVSDFSGGWRIRLNLAQTLMTPSDLLLLDEPTNHLDLDATLWLQGWLRSYPGTLLMISHDRDFIDATCERTLKIESGRLATYRGGYSDYERQQAEQLSQQQATFDKQQRRVAEIEDFVRRFRYKATKAKQAQSRLKELERMQRVAPAHVDSPFYFQFPDPGKSSDPLLQLDSASLGYGDKTVLKSVDITLRPGDRIGLLGKNGAGKSTLLKSLTGRLPTLSGNRKLGAHLRIGYFDQQQLEVLDLDASPLLHLQRLTQDRREQELLDFLGGFNFRGDAAKSPIENFSGGEKARLALAMVVWQDPNLLVLDEPTNHLDLDMRHALEVALQGYEGALVLVSHDRHLLRNSVEELVLVHDGRVEIYNDDLNAYERWILSADGKATTTIPQDSGSAATRKEQRQLAAEARAKLRPLRKALEKVERDMDALQTQLTSIQQSLSDPTLYEEHRKSELAEIVRTEGQLKAELAETEEQWLKQQDELESLEAQG
jgi:ATP-binding cassette subfamily F protein 3